MKRLPPLKSLQAFEAAGRHLSFTEAARELSVTPGAISQQIRMLEDFLETMLFRRLNRSIALTADGQIFLPLISNGFEQFNEAVSMLGQKRSEGPLTITSAPSFVSKWLIPRLAKFKAAHPGIDVRIDTSDRLVDFKHEDIDVGIRFGNGVYPELDTEISDLKHHTLLHSNYDELDPGFPDWAMWLKVVGADGIDTDHGIYFNQSDLLFQAALDGQGVALLANVMAEPEISAGRLVQPFATRLPVKLNYHLVTSPAKSRIAKVAAFRAWILDESAYLRDPSDQA
jgi:LysR family glycine cleavage system transcriptional activator